MSVFLDAIKGVMRRTERDVALAGVMIGSVKSMEKLFPPIEHYSELKVVFYGNSWNSWVMSCDDGGRLKGAWRDFLKWYHGRPQSECFVVRHEEGETMFRRCDIRGYELRVGTRAKSK